MFIYISFEWVCDFKRLYIKSFWSAKVNVVFICEIKLLKRTHTIQFIRLPVRGGFRIYDKRYLVTLFIA